jgi:hypothetical protein
MPAIFYDPMKARAERAAAYARQRERGVAVPADDSPAMTPTQLRELMKDAEACARLSTFEEDFCDNLRGRLLMYGDTVKLTEKQTAIARAIEAKVYAT